MSTSQRLYNNISNLLGTHLTENKNVFFMTLQRNEIIFDRSFF